MTVAPPRPIRLRSARKTLAPARSASIAAYMPAPPDPMIRTSVSTCMGATLMPALRGRHYIGLQLLSSGAESVIHLGAAAALARRVGGRLEFVDEWVKFIEIATTIK